MPILRRRPQFSGHVVHEETDIVIEGFPRSANTFAAAAMQFACHSQLDIARHTHAPAQVIRGVQLDIPTLVLIRHPRDAAVSLVLRESHLSLRQALRAYRRFYETIHPYRDSFLVADFNQATENFGQLVDKLNRKYNTEFPIFKHTKESVSKVFRIVEQMDKEDTGKENVDETTVARPSRERNEQKKKLKKKFHHHDLEGPFMKAMDAYTQLSSFQGTASNKGSP